MIGVFITLGVLGYVLQIATPLRINYDALDFLRMAASNTDETGLYPDRNVERYPPLYPLLLSLLAKQNLLTSVTAVLLNLIFIGVGILSFYFLFSNYSDPNKITNLLTIVFVLFSWILIKHATIPLSDPLYFGISLAGLFFLVKSSSKKCRNWPAYFLIGGVLCMAGLLTRYVGICLILTMVWCIYLHLTREKVWGYIVDRFLAAAGITLSGSLIIFVSCGKASFPMPEAIERVFDPTRIQGTIIQRLFEIGGLFFNTPTPLAEKISILPIFMGIAGLGITGICLTCMFPRNQQRIPPWTVYLNSYLTLIFLAPWEDPRYLLPVAPFIFYLFLEKVRQSELKKKIWQILLLAWGFLFIFLGGVAFVYSTWLSWSGPKFAERFGSATSRKEYLVFYRNEPTEDNLKISSRTGELFRILDRFDSQMKGSLNRVQDYK